MHAAALLLVSLGKWRYFITGTVLAVSFGLVLRACGRLAAPFGEWRRFRGICIGIRPADGKNAVTVQFSDKSRLTHTVVLLTDEDVQPQQEMQIAIRTELFASGSYPQTAEEAGERDIITASQYRKMLRSRLGRELLIGLVSCGAAVCISILVMRLCFPAH